MERNLISSGSEASLSQQNLSMSLLLSFLVHRNLMDIGNLGRYFNTYDITVNFEFALFDFHWVLPDC